MILYSDDTSPWCAPVRAAIYAKGLDVRIEPPPGGMHSDEYRRLSVTKTIPCLILPDGTPLPESAVIVAYLDERFAERPLAPPDPQGRARIALLQRFAEQGLMAPIVQLFHDLAEGVADAKPKALESLTTGLSRIEHFLADGGYAAGPEFTRADCFLGPALFGVMAFAGALGEPQLLTRFPKVASYAPRAMGHPAIAKVLAELQAALAANQTAMPAGLSEPNAP
jgi:glutathione S-transferase